MRIRCLIAAAALAAAITPKAYADSQVLELFSGLPKDVPVQGSNIEIETDRKLIKAQLSKDKRTLRITPLATGHGTLVVKSKLTGKIAAQFILNINDPKLLVVQSEAQQALKDVDGIHFRVANGLVLIDGQVFTARDLSRIHNVAKLHSDNIRSLVVINPASYQSVARAIEREIGNPEIHVKIINGKILLEGTASTEAERQRADIIAQMYAPDSI